MPETVPKNPAKVRAGQIGARQRWGPKRILRLDQLDADERRLVQALLDAKRNADAVARAGKVAETDAA